MSHSDPSFDPSRFDEIYDDFVARMRRREWPMMEEYIERYPELEERIREFFPLVAKMEGLDEGTEVVGGGNMATDQPEQIGEHRILREIGRGGMGIVYEAEQRTLERRVALKVLPQSSARSTSSRERFQREARAAAGLHHSNIVPVFEVGSEAGYDYYTMQLILGHGLDQIIDELHEISLRSRKVDSRSLLDDDSAPVDRPEAFPRSRQIAESLHSDRFTAPGSLESNSSARNSSASASSGTDRASASSSVLHPPSDSAVTGQRSFFRAVARIGQQVAEALDHAHSRGIVHRDIKPSNLLLDAAGEVWVTDFGLAKTEEVDLTQTGEMVGTLRYMAPERFAGECSSASDVYALGVTLYELAVLQPAFKEPDRLALFEAIRTKEPASPRSLDGRIPVDLEIIITTAMSKEPRDRYPTAKALAEDLERFRQDRPILARKATAFGRLIRWSRRNPSLAASLSGVFILLGVAATIFGIGQSNERAQRVELEDQFYRSQMTLAGLAADSVLGYRQIGQISSRWVSPSGEFDPRGWEWFHFRALTHQHILEVDIGDESTGGLIDWSRDGQFLFAVSSRGALTVIVVESEAIVKTLHDHSETIVAIETSPNGRFLLTATVDGLLHVRSTDTLERLARFQIPDVEHSLNGVQWHPDSSRILASFQSAHPAILYEFDGARMAPVAEIPASNAGAFSPDGRFLATRPSPQRPKLENGNTPDVGLEVREAQSLEVTRTVKPPRSIMKPLQQFEEPQVAPSALHWSPDGTSIAWGTAFGPVLWRDWEKTDSILQRLKFTPGQHGSTKSAESVTWGPDGRQFASMGRDGIVRIWDLMANRDVQWFAIGEPLTDIAWDRRGNRVATIANDMRVQAWDLDHASPIRHLSSPNTVPGGARVRLFWSHDNQRVMRSGPRAFEIDLETDRIVAIPDFVAYWDGADHYWCPNRQTIEIRQRSTGVVSTFPIEAWPREIVRAPARGISGRGTFVTTSDGRLLRIDESSALPPEVIATGIPLPHAGLAVSPDGDTAIVCAYRSLLWINTRTGEKNETEMPTHSTSATFGPDGRWLAVTTGRPESLIFDAHTREIVHQLSGHLIEPLGAAFHPDGTRLATASADRTTRLWDPRTGDPITVFEEAGEVLNVSWSPDGSRLASLLRDGSVVVREAPGYDSEQ